MISVITPTYNRPILLMQTIESFLIQNMKTQIQAEMIIVNDGSDKEFDNDYEMVFKKYCNIVNIRWINKVHTGLPSTLNEGIKNARGNLICIIADDDLLLSDSLINRKNVFNYNNEVEMIYTGYHNIAVDGKLLSKCKVEPIDKDRIFKEDYINIQSLMWRKSIHDRIGYFNEKLIQAEDWDWKIRCLYECNCLAVDLYTVATRRHNEMKSMIYRKENKKYCDEIIKELSLKYGYNIDNNTL